MIVNASIERMCPWCPSVHRYALDGLSASNDHLNDEKMMVSECDGFDSGCGVWTMIYDHVCAIDCAICSNETMMMSVIAAKWTPVFSIFCPLIQNGCCDFDACAI